VAAGTGTAAGARAEGTVADCVEPSVSTAAGAFPSFFFRLSLDFLTVAAGTAGERGFLRAEHQVRVAKGGREGGGLTSPRTRSKTQLLQSRNLPIGNTLRFVSSFRSQQTELGTSVGSSQERMVKQQTFAWPSRRRGCPKSWG
jgi:hypothetical protein